jgi:hypothetical protein
VRVTNPNWKDNYQYIEDGELPVLVLGIPIHWQYPETYNAKPSDEFQWRKIVHQTAGYACRQHYIEGLVLPVTSKVKDFMRLIESRYIETQICQPARLETAVSYQAELKRMFGGAVCCENSYHMLEEGIYPIDVTAEVLEILTTAKLPKELDDLIQWESDLEQLCGILGRWHLFILGENSD